MTSIESIPLKNHPYPAKDDPSHLTVKMMLRELANQKEVTVSRMDGSDKLIELLQGGLEKVLGVVVSEVNHLGLLHNEKFASIDKQFLERDVRTDLAASAVKIAVDAALQAQKEAVGKSQESSDKAITKSEVSTTKQIDQIEGIIRTNTENTNDKFDDMKTRTNIMIDDIKSRLNTMDGKLTAGREHKDDSRANIAIGVSVLMAIMSIGALLYSAQDKARESALAVTPPQIVYLPAPAVQALPIPAAAGPRILQDK